MEDQKLVTIHPELNLGKKDVELHMTASVDGVVIVDKVSDSLLYQFLNTLEVQMGGPEDQIAWIERSTNPVTITNVSSSSTPEGGVKITHTNTTMFDDWRVAIGGVSGSVVTNGIWPVKVINTTTTALVGSVWSGSYISGGAFRYFSNSGIPTYSNRANDTNFQHSGAGIYVGTGTGSVTTKDMWLENEIQNGTTAEKLTYGTATITQDTYDGTTCQVTFTRTFANNSGGTIVINEVGLALYSSTEPGLYRQLMARDVVAGGIPINNGKTLTLTYQFQTVMDPTYGGFTNKFMALFYRLAGQTSRDARDIDNQANIKSPDVSTLKVASSGGNTYQVSGARLGSDYGIQIGTGDTAPSTGDYNLASLITHGTGSSQMLHYGGVFSYIEDEPSLESSFTISKVFENKSGDSIVVKEAGIFAASGTSTSYDTMEYSHCIVRNVLDSPKTVLNDQILKVVYTIKVVL
jgi:hypothetical protein